MSLGIDIGKFSIKAVQLSKDGDEVKVDNIGIINTFDDINKFNLDSLSKSQVSACLQDLLAKMNIKPKKVKNIVSSLSGKSTDIRQITTLDMPDNELLVSLELEAKKHVPLDGTEAIIDYFHLGNSPNELDKINVILVTTTKNKIKDHAEIVKNAGLKPGIFDCDPIGISNLYQFSNELPENGADVLLDIGHTSTTLVVWGKNSSYFSREIEIGGHQINKALMQEFNLDYQSADTKKNDLGVNSFDKKNASEDEDNGISIEQRTIFNDFIEEVRKTLRFYMKNNNQSFFNSFFLTGGCANLPGLSDFIASNLNVTIKDFNAFNNIKTDSSIENPNQFALALGLALRGFEK
tara:strand:- start:1290 stop:2339 length:1050 start_codon:yes stop_codon:yes gene_type:complete